MHDHVRDLGRLIVRDEHPSKRTRIWSNEDAVDMLINGEGTVNLEVLRVENFEFTEKEFQKVSGLRYLEVYDGRFTGNFKKILPNLRWLRLHECSSITIDFDMKKLVILSLRKCAVEDDWKGWNSIKEARRLKAIDIPLCDGMTELPDLCRCRSLEWINFGDCWGMGGELHIGNFKDLRVLNIASTRITKLIGDIGRLQNLQEIVARESGLIELSASIGKLSSLKILELRGLKIEILELPTSLKQLSVPWPRVPNLLELKDLEKLWLHCDTLEIPRDMWKLSKLKELWLLKVGNGKDALELRQDPVNPDSQSHYSRGLGIATIISSPPTLPSSLNYLFISGSQHLERLPNIANLSNLTALSLNEIGLQKTIDLRDLRMLKTLCLRASSNLIRLGGVEHLELLEALKLDFCGALRELPSLSNLTKLRELEINHSPLLSEIQGLGELGNLLTLRIWGCHKLTYMTGLDKLESLQHLEISDCKLIKKLPNLCALKLLINLFISGCNQLTEVTGIDKLQSLKQLMITKCASIKELPDLSVLEHLQVVLITGCNQLTEVSGRSDWLRQKGLFKKAKDAKEE